LEGGAISAVGSSGGESGSGVSGVGGIGAHHSLQPGRGVAVGYGLPATHRSESVVSSARWPAQPRQPERRRTLRQTERQRRQYAWGNPFTCERLNNMTIVAPFGAAASDKRLTYRGRHGGNN
jgi:hypothetical protein